MTLTATISISRGVSDANEPTIAIRAFNFERKLRLALMEPENVRKDRPKPDATVGGPLVGRLNVRIEPRLDILDSANRSHGVEDSLLLT